MTWAAPIMAGASLLGFLIAFIVGLNLIKERQWHIGGMLVALAVVMYVNGTALAVLWATT